MVLYNLGVLYFKQGVDFVSKANQTKDDAEYKKLRHLGNEKFKKAISYMEQALEVKPDETNVLHILKTLYYRLRTEDPKYVKKFKEVTRKLKYK